MGLWIDIYRYQKVTNWRAVRGARIRIKPDRAPQPIDAVYVKATDGAGIAMVPADNQVRGAKSVAFPVGLYHFSQPGNARSQARLLLREVDRLGAGDMPPMLDLEDNPPGSGKPNIPHAQKPAYAKDFLDEIRLAGYRPCVYMSASDAKSLRPDTWGDDVLVWIASYGPNNGYQNKLTGGYGGRYEVWQYTSVGAVPGIEGSVDLNESFVEIGADDVSAQDVWNYELPPLAADNTEIPGQMVKMGEYERQNNRALWILVSKFEQLQAGQDLIAADVKGLTDDEVNIVSAVLAAIRENPTKIDMTEGHLQQLLDGLSAATVRIIRDLAAAMLAAAMLAAAEPAPAPAEASAEQETQP